MILGIYYSWTVMTVGNQIVGWLIILEICGYSGTKTAGSSTFHGSVCFFKMGKTKE